MPGDDLLGLQYDPIVDSGASAQRFTRHVGDLAPMSVKAGGAITIACWVNWVRTTVDGPDILYLVGNTSYMIIYRDSVGGTYRFGAQDNSTGSIDVAAVQPTNVGLPVLLALRLTESSGLLEFWVNADAPQTATISGVPTTADFFRLRVGGYAPAMFAHVQIYFGAGSYTRSMHLAQYQMGLTGLERQTTGDRIRSIAGYAGIPAAEVTQVDKGQSVMQVARLAGKDPLTAMRDAERTEQGLLYVDGSGGLVFKDRSSLYNI